MDPKHSGDVVNHMEKQNELWMDAYRSMSHELHRLQVEQEMLMRKYYECMAAQDLLGNKTNDDIRDIEENSEAGALVRRNYDPRSLIELSAIEILLLLLR